MFACVPSLFTAATGCSLSGRARQALLAAHHTDSSLREARRHVIWRTSGLPGTCSTPVNASLNMDDGTCRQGAACRHGIYVDTS
jgi:hypothetical protein